VGKPLASGEKSVLSLLGSGRVILAKVIDFTLPELRRFFMTKICLVCEKDYQTKNKNAKFCSRDCRYKYLVGRPQLNRRKRTNKTCKYCGKLFEVRLCEKNENFCNIRCYWKSRKGVRVAPQSEFKKGSIIGKEYWIKPGTSLSPETQFKKGQTSPIKKYNKAQKRMVKAMRQRVVGSVKRGKMSISVTKLVGADIELLCKRLESMFYDRDTGEKMTWDNYGFSGWHIDHIKPISSFNLDNESELKNAFHYTNVQPLWMEDNLRKMTKIGWSRYSPTHSVHQAVAGP
jgi:hypothetical protein